MKKEKIQIVHLQMVKDREVPYGNTHLNDPEEAMRFIKDVIADMICSMDRECIVVCAVDTKLKPVSIQITGVGTIDSCLYSVPEIFKMALLSNAASILLFHNHPSGDPTPSKEDIQCSQYSALSQSPVWRSNTKQGRYTMHQNNSRGRKAIRDNPTGSHHIGR